jgi:hypothetical protein
MRLLISIFVFDFKTLNFVLGAIDEAQNSIYEALTLLPVFDSINQFICD